MQTCAYADIIVGAQLGMMLVFGDHRNTQRGSNEERRTFEDGLVLLPF